MCDGDAVPQFYVGTPTIYVYAILFLIFIYDGACLCAWMSEFGSFGDLSIDEGLPAATTV